MFGEGGGSGCGGKKAVPTPCPVCGKVLSNAYNMRVHLETHEDISYKCLICGIITRTRDTMRKHLSNVHKLRNIELRNSFKKITGKSNPSSAISRGSTSGSTTTLKSSPTSLISKSKNRAASSHLGAAASKLSAAAAAAVTNVWTFPKTEPLWTMPHPPPPPPSMEPPMPWTPPPPPNTSASGNEVTNFTKGSLASIVNKLSQKQ